MQHCGPIVTADWLWAHQHDPDLRIVDATVHLPDTGRNARDEYLSEHIPGAVFFDFDRICDPANPLPRKFPPASVLAAEVGALGISNDTLVVAYDTPGLYSAARVWWLLRQYGHDRVAVLDGGLKAWKVAGYPVQAGEVSVAPKRFDPAAQGELFADWQSVLASSHNPQSQILDARTPGRFAGTETDRYPGTRPGHIPGSRNLYWANLLDPATRQLLPPEQIRQRFDDAGLRWQDPVTLTCGSGLTACILALGLEMSGKHDWRVYDGSWDEWGRRMDLPVRGAEPDAETARTAETAAKPQAGADR